MDIDAGERRFVHIGLPGQPEMGIWLMKAETTEQIKKVGRQTEGQPCAVIYTDDLQSDYERLTGRGVRFTRQPKNDLEASYAHFPDLFGNEFVLVELAEQ